MTQGNNTNVTGQEAFAPDHVERFMEHQIEQFRHLARGCGWFAISSKAKLEIMQAMSPAELRAQAVRSMANPQNAEIVAATRFPKNDGQAA